MKRWTRYMVTHFDDRTEEKLLSEHRWRWQARLANDALFTNWTLILAATAHHNALGIGTRILGVTTEIRESEGPAPR